MTSVRTPPIAFALVALAVLAVAGCGSSSSSTSGTGPVSDGTSPTTPTTSVPRSSTTSTRVPVPGQVDIVDYDFSPTTITVKAGEQVVWLNEDDVDHWVITAPGTPQPFDLGRQGAAASASRTFEIKGRFPYFCNLHNYMKGEVVVQ